MTIRSRLRRRCAIAVVAGAGLLVPLPAAAQEPALPPALPRPAVGPERPFQVPERHEKTLASGLRVVVVRKATVPKVSTVLTIKAGLADDSPALPGVAALTADAIQEGTAKRDSRQIRREAFAMGASLNASAAQDYTSVTLRGLAEFLPDLLDLLSDVVQNPTFPPAEIAIIKARRQQRLQQEAADPETLSERTFRKVLFGDHPYARVSPTPESLATIERSHLAAFHDATYRPDRSFLLVVGDVAPDAVFAAAERSFGRWAQKPSVREPAPAPPPVSGRRLVFVQRPGSIQSAISVGNLAVSRTDPRWYDLLVANTIYGGAFNSRIVRNIREDKGYTYSPFSQFGAFGLAGFYRFAASVRNEVTGATLTEIYGEIDKLREEGAAGAELDGVKQYLRGVFVLATSTQAGMANALNTVYTFGLPADYLENYRTRISEMTPDRVRAAARTLLGSTDSVIVIVGDYPKVKDQLAGFANVTFVDADGNPVSPPAGAP